MPTYDDVLLTYDDPDNTYEGGGGEGYEWSEPVSAYTQLPSDQLPSLFVEADFESLPLELPTEWTDLPTFRSVSIRQGRQRLLDRTEVGQASVVLDNRERDYDPTLHPEVRPANHLRIRARHGGVTYPLFRGYVRSWPQEWPSGGYDAVSPVQAEDAFALMARYELEGDAITEMGAGAHIREVLTRFGWPEAGEVPEGTTWWILGDAASELGTNTILGESLSEIDDGLSTIMALDLEGNLLDHLLNVAETTEGGTFYMARDGNVTFRQRQVSGSLPTGTWGDEDGENRYVELSVTYDDSLIYNDVRGQRRGAAALTPVTDAESTLLYGPRTLSVTDLLHSTTEAAEERVSDLLNKHDQAQLYPSRLTMRPKPDSTVWPLIFTMTFGDTITVRRRPPGGGDMIELTCFVIGVEYQITPDVWEISWDLAKARTFLDPWLLGTAGRSELGTTTQLA